MSNTAVHFTLPELGLRLRQQELVAEFGRFAMQMESFEGILDQASIVAADGLDARFAKVLQYQPGEMDFIVRSGVGWNEGVVGNAHVGGDLQSPAGYAFRSGNPVISNHLASEQRFRTPKLLADHGIRSAINVLIQVNNGERFGVLEGDSTHRDDFNEHDTAFLQALANTLAIAIELQERQDARKALLRENQKLLHEKDVLMQEVHHRVKNSLQLVHSILSMQAKTLANPDAKDQLDEAASRIMTIAAVHHRLYAGGSVTETDAAQYLSGLLSDMRGMLPDMADDRALILKVEPFSLEADYIAPLGLITCELVTNALKYGRGSVEIALQRNTNGLEISVSDEGDGFPANFAPTARRGLGMRMINLLAKMPGGEAIRVDRSVSFGRIVVRTGFGGMG
jgi:two-component sensor histidine kinase